MRVVVDTNVFISAALKDRSLPAIVLRRIARQDVLLKSAATEHQLLAVIARPRFGELIAPASREWLAGLMTAAEPVAIAERIAACRDPTDDKFLELDDKFLELAVNGRADVLVSGDRDLLVLAPFRGIPVVDPGGFLHRFG